MTISAVSNQIYHNGNGVAKAFTFPYRVLVDNHLEVYVKGFSTSYVKSVLNGVGTYDYTITGVGTDSCTVTFNTAPGPWFKAVYMVRTVPLTQISDYVSGDEFPMEVLENDLDKMVMIAQQLEERLSRSLTLPRSAVTFATDIPNPIYSPELPQPPLSSVLLAAKADGTGFEWVVPLTFGALVVSPYILNLLDDVDPVAARATLGTPAQTDGFNLRPRLQSPREPYDFATPGSGTVVLDLNSRNYYILTLTGNITTLTISNAPVLADAFALTLEIIQGGSGSYTIAWPGTVRWPGGVAPTLTATVGKTDFITLVTRNAGATWNGFVAGQNF